MESLISICSSKGKIGHHCQVEPCNNPSLWSPYCYQVLNLMKACNLGMAKISTPLNLPYPTLPCTGFLSPKEVTGKGRDLLYPPHLAPPPPKKKCVYIHVLNYIFKIFLFYNLILFYIPIYTFFWTSIYNYNFFGTYSIIIP